MKEIKITTKNLNFPVTLLTNEVINKYIEDFLDDNFFDIVLNEVIYDQEKY